MEKEKLDKILEDHKLWLSDNKSGSRANLRGANLRGANLRGADLRGADIDYSALPLSCKGLKIKIDKRIACQLAYHFCCQECDDAEYQDARKVLLPFANKFHRVDECGILE